MSIDNYCVDLKCHKRKIDNHVERLREGLVSFQLQALTISACEHVSSIFVTEPVSTSEKESKTASGSQCGCV